MGFGLSYPGWLRRPQADSSSADREKKLFAFRACHFLRLNRNRKPRMKSLWHPGQVLSDLKSDKSKVASVKPKRKHCRKRIPQSGTGEKRKNSINSRRLKKMLHIGGLKLIRRIFSSFFWNKHMKDDFADIFRR